MVNRLRFAVLVALFVVPIVQAQSPGVRYINPPGLVKPSGYTHVVVAGDGTRSTSPVK